MRRAHQGEALVDVALGFVHGCGIRQDGSLTCWGAGKSGDGCEDPTWACGQAMAPEGAFDEVAADHTHTCARRVDGSIACFGSNAAGEATPD